MNSKMGKEIADNYLENFGIEAYKEKNLNALIDYGRLSEEYQLVAKDDLQQSGILGMKWGIHRYQNEDGSLTAEGKKQKQGAIDELKKDKENYVKRTEWEVARDKKHLEDVLSGKQERYITDEEHSEDPKNPIIDVAKLFRDDIASRVKNLPIMKKKYDDEIADFESDRVQVGKDYVYKKQKSKLLRSTYGSPLKVNTSGIKSLRKEGEFLNKLEDDFDYGYITHDQLVAKDAFQQSGIIGMKWGVIRSQEQLGRKEGTGENKGTKNWDEDETKFLKNLEEKVDKEAEGSIDHASSIYSEEVAKYVKANKDRYTLNERAKFAKKYITNFDEEEESEYRMQNDKDHNAAIKNQEEKMRTVQEENPHLELRFDQNDYWAGHKLLAEEGWDTWNNRLSKKPVKHGQGFSEEYLSYFGNATLNALSTQELDEDFLAQSGILGMHWGIIRTREALARLGGRLSRNGRKKPSEPLAPSTRTKRLSELTDAELNTVIARLQKEKLYKDLVNPQGRTSNPVVQKGESIVKTMMKNIGKSLATKFAEGAGIYLANKFVSGRQVKLDAENDNERARLARNNAKREESRQKKSDYAKETVVKNKDLSWQERKERKKNPKEYDASVQRGRELAKKKWGYGL